ncbi:MAG: DNA alkylation repair protein [Alphaproteobacteria bacterium]|nr:DNA alkylation repair protein [Alphaproteobacteria bacterium]
MSATKPASSVKSEVARILAWLKKRGTKKNRDGMARFGIVTPKAFGVSMATMKTLVKSIDRSHELALALWATGWHEARLLAALIDEPERVTPAQMDAWAKSFNNWADCDTACFQLFDRTPHVFKKAAQWSKRREEFVKRAAFALLASAALHDKKADDAAFLRALPLIERAATDERNFVKKGVNWALRAMGERSTKLNNAATVVAERLAKSESASARWIGKDALRQLKRPATLARLARRSAKAGVK